MTTPTGRAASSTPSRHTGRAPAAYAEGVNPTVPLRVLGPPEVLHRGDGYTLWHGGITDGPHGMSLIVEVLDESGARRMNGDEWQSSPQRRWPVELTATAPDVQPARPHEIIEARSPHYYRLICTFGKYGRSLGPRPGPAGVQLEFVVHPLDVRVARHVSGEASILPA